MDSSSTASDVITYIGVPLAVLGVAPIFYNTVITLQNLAKVRRLLRKSRLAGITRGDVVNRVIECELARFQIAPLDRETDVKEYWNVYEHPSLVPGGSWTVFNWKMHAIGIRTQRIQYADQLRQPQAEILFEELLSYLLDLGAVPSAIGFSMLRTSGLWIPVGTPLLLSPDSNEPTLTIAPLDDSDGMLSLSVRWSRNWVIRGNKSLPPYWVQIEEPRCFPPDPWSASVEEQGSESPTEERPQFSQKGSENAETGDTLLPGFENGLPNYTSVTSEDEVNVKRTPSVCTGAEAKAGDNSNPLTAVRCRITSDGVDMVISLRSHEQKEIDIRHLKVTSSGSTSAGAYIASLCTAMSARNHDILWSYQIQPDVLMFCRGPLMPCGLLVQLGIVPLEATPEWYHSELDDMGAEQELVFRRLREMSMAADKERKMSPKERIIAQRERHQRQHQNFVDDQREKRRLETQRQEQRMLDALQSPLWKINLISQHALTWLKKQKVVKEEAEVEEVAKGILFRMIQDPSFATEQTEMLNSWKDWLDGGGIQRAHYRILEDKKRTFALAALVLKSLADSASVDDRLTSDVQEVLRVWRKVRLG
jgi:hypothetical protein